MTPPDDAARTLRLIADESGGDVWTAINRLPATPPLERHQVIAALRAGADTIDRAEAIAEMAWDLMRLKAFEQTVRTLAAKLPDSTVAAAVDFFDAGLRTVFEPEDGAR